MDQDQIEIITVKDMYSAEIEKPAGAAVGETFNAHKGSKEADAGNQPQNLNHTSDAQEVQAGESTMSYVETRIRTLAEVKGLDPTKINLWKVAYEDFTSKLTIHENRLFKGMEEMRSVKNEIYQVVGFFSAFQGLLITAAAQSTLLRCNNMGFLLALSAFATAIAVFGIWQKITAMEELRSANIAKQYDIEAIRHWLNYLQVKGIDSDFRSLPRSYRPIRYFHTWWKEVLVSYRTWLVVSVIAFGGLSMVAMHQIVCNPGHSLPSN